MRFRCLAALSVVLCSAIAFGQTTRPNQLKVGDPAPALAVESWAQGTSIPAFEPGKVYVLEFWATWCGPCIAAMPHLTELAKQYEGKATFIGVNVLERGESEDPPVTARQQVDAFLKGNPGRMGYDVAVDGAAGKMWETWGRASGQRGIPCSFVIDRQGKIAWIGHPMRLDPVIEGVVNNTGFDVAKYEEEVKQKAAAKQAALSSVRRALRNRDYPAVLEAVAKVEKETPEYAPDTAGPKLIALIDTDPDAAVALIRQDIADKNQRNLSTYGFLANDLEDAPKEVYLASIDGLLALVRPEDKSGLSDTYIIVAGIYSKIKDHSSAVKYARLAVQNAKDANASASKLKQYQRLADNYEEAAALSRTK